MRATSSPFGIPPTTIGPSEDARAAKGSTRFAILLEPGGRTTNGLGSCATRSSFLDGLFAESIADNLEIGGISATFERKRYAGRAFAVAWNPCYTFRMIAFFRDRGSEDVFNGVDSRSARKACPGNLWKLAARKLDALDAAHSLNDLRVPPGNRLEALTGNRKGQHSIRINDQYRICFRWTERGAADVEVCDYH